MSCLKFLYIFLRNSRVYQWILFSHLKKALWGFWGSFKDYINYTLNIYLPISVTIACVAVFLMKIAIKDQMDRKNVGWSTYLPKHYLQLVLPGVRNTFMAKEMKKDLQDGRLKKKLD